MSKNRIKGKACENGQVAIFVAVMFQVLFVFFAMMVNVGLLVHHKINLQNSADLAAYYGAMKQAENLNAIAHVNYQIRQSWKLLSFRYRHLGAYGDRAYPGRQSIDSPSDERPKGAFFPAFCINYAPWVDADENNSTCSESARRQPFVSQKTSAPQFMNTSSTNLSGNLVPFAQVNTDVRRKDRVTAQLSCERTNILGYYLLSYFIYAWKSDVANRKKLIYAIANSMSDKKNDFMDLDGQSVFSGVEKTLQKNLTYQNLQGIVKQEGRYLRFFNSLGETLESGGAHAHGPKWLRVIRAYPIFWTLMSMSCETNSSNNSNKISYNPYAINLGHPIPSVISRTNPNVGLILDSLKDYINEPLGSPGNHLFEATLGVEKNPWYVPYVMVHVESQPQIPFAPLGSITLKATAYAKPFGGTIGPWWGQKWDFAGEEGSVGSPVDEGHVYPPRVLSVGDFPTSAQVADAKYILDYPRYVGDAIGTKSKLTMFYYAQAFKTFSELNASFWTHINDINGNPDKVDDLLAHPNPGVQDFSMAMKMRAFETTVISPDQWDISYYSIEPDFYNNYYKRLKVRERSFGFPVRGDLGMMAKDNSSGSFSVKDQMAVAKNFSSIGLPDLVRHLRYFALTPGELLTGFKGRAPDDPRMNPENFGKCRDNPGFLKTSIPGDCLVGGRVGYSVKLVDGEFLKSQSLWGGPTGGQGYIKILPPDI